LHEIGSSWRCANPIADILKDLFRKQHKPSLPIPGMIWTLPELFSSYSKGSLGSPEDWTLVTYPEEETAPAEVIEVQEETLGATEPGPSTNRRRDSSRLLSTSSLTLVPDPVLPHSPTPVSVPEPVALPVSIPDQSSLQQGVSVAPTSSSTLSLPKQPRETCPIVTSSTTSVSDDASHPPILATPSTNTATSRQIPVNVSVTGSSEIPASTANVDPGLLRGACKSLE
jgi:hypothetical protein